MIIGLLAGVDPGRLDDPGPRGVRAQPAVGQQAVQQHHVRRAGRAAGDAARARRAHRLAHDQRGPHERLHRPDQRRRALRE